MLPVPTSIETSRRVAPRVSPEADVFAHDPDSHLPAELLAGEPCEDSDDQLRLIEMRYQQYVAQRELQDLFENGFLQSLGW
jgi:hypothetical protein